MAAPSRTAAARPTLDVTRLIEAVADAPYQDLEAAIRAAGWSWSLVEREVAGTQHGYLVWFDLVVTDPDGVSGVLSRVTAALPSNIAAVSLGGRFALQQTVLYLLAGRTPPAPEKAAPAPAPTDRYEIDATGDDGDIVLEETPSWRDAPVAEAVDVVASKTPDGLPVFRDLYAMGAPGREIVAAVLREIEDCLAAIVTSDQLDTLYRLNAEAVEFVKDIGTPQDLERLKQVIAKKRGLIVGGFASQPRRRAAATN